MAHLVVTSEAVFDAAPERVWPALIDEMSGATHWWRPYWEARPRRGGRVDQIGAEILITVHPRGAPSKPALRCAFRTLVVDAARRLHGVYIEGAFRGEDTWSLEPHGTGTRVVERFDTRTHGVFPSVLGMLADMRAGHANVMREGFERLARWLADDAQRMAASR